jgi:hypothetical protein
MNLPRPLVIVAFGAYALSLLFLVLRLGGYIAWPWSMVFAPIWLTWCAGALIGAYLVLLAIVERLRSPA